MRPSTLDKAPRLSIRIVSWILPSDTGDDLYCICFDHPNRDTAMLSTQHWYHIYVQNKPAGKLVDVRCPTHPIPYMYAYTYSAAVIHPSVDDLFNCNWNWSSIDQIFC